MAIELTEEQKKQGYKVVKLGELVSSAKGSISIGPFGSRMKAENYVENGIPVVRGNNIGSKPGFTNDFVYVSEEFADNLENQKIFPGDLVFPHRGAIGRVGIATSDDFKVGLLSTSLMKLRVDETLALPEYIYYYFRTSRGEREILSYASSVGTPGIGQPLTSLKKFEVVLPPLVEQKRIANILGSLDDKIEANNSIIQIISDLVVAEVEKLDLFDKNSDATLNDIIEFSPKVSKPSTNDFQFIDMSALPTQGAVTAEILRKEKWSGSKFEEGDTLLARITPCLENGKTAIAMGLNGEPAVGSTEFIVMRPRIKDQGLLVYGIARSQKFREIAIQKMTGSSGRQRVRWQDLSSIPINLQNINNFSHESNRFELLRNLRKENNILNKQREILLKSLIK